MNGQQARQRLYSVMAQDTEFAEKAEQALKLGEEYLGVDNAHLTEIHPESNYWKAISSTDPPDGDFPTGQRLDLQTTYCRRVLDADDSVALHDAPNQGWDDDQAFETHGLRCYHGSPLTVDGDHYGTLCFVSVDPRGAPFTEDETAFAELMARMFEHEIQRERTEMRIERLEQFASVLAHDLRNPLAGAIGFVEVARETGDVEYLEDAETSLDRIEQIISDVLAMARQATIVEETEEVELKGLCDECWKNAETADAELVVENNITIRAARGRLRHLFENLFRNAAEHGGQEVTVRVGPLAGEEGFYVEDTGTGIPAGKQETVFDRGESGDDGELGIGLAIVDGVAAAHDWDIAVTESATGGARFEVRNVVTVDTAV